MSKDDDDDVQDAIGVGRYPVMPSLVALQQMKNRLQLATLGQKLMKWSALATGRELRRLSMIIMENYDDYDALVANAYIKLARSRYYYENLNKMILENTHRDAECRVVSEIRPIAAGVRVLQYEVTENRDNVHYQYLGMEKGGETIKSAKLAWRELIKRMVLLTQLRTSFDAVNTANLSAVKRKNVLQKIVIPKTNATIKYVLLELEETAREEKFRVKKIVEVKKKKKEQYEEHIESWRRPPKPLPEKITKETIPIEPPVREERFRETLSPPVWTPSPPLVQTPPSPLLVQTPPSPPLVQTPPSPSLVQTPPSPPLVQTPPLPPPPQPLPIRDPLPELVPLSEEVPEEEQISLSEWPPQPEPPPPPKRQPLPELPPKPIVQDALPKLKPCVLCGASESPYLQLIPTCGIKSLQLTPGMEMMVPLPPCSIITIHVSAPCLQDGKGAESKKAELIFKTMAICPECERTPSSKPHDKPPNKSISGQTYACGCPDHVNTACVAGDLTDYNNCNKPSETEGTYTGSDTSAAHEASTSHKSSTYHACCKSEPKEFVSQMALCEPVKCLFEPIEEKNRSHISCTFSEPVIGSPKKKVEPMKKSSYENNKTCLFYPKKPREICNCGKVSFISSKPSEIRCICASRYVSKESCAMPSQESVRKVVGELTNVSSTSSSKKHVSIITTPEKRVSHALTQTSVSYDINTIKCKDIVHYTTQNSCHECDSFIKNQLNEIVDLVVLDPSGQNRSQKLLEVDCGRADCPKVESKTRIKQFRPCTKLSSSEIKRIEKTINIKRYLYPDGIIDVKENVKLVTKRRISPSELKVLEQSNKSSHETEHEYKRAMSSCCFTHEPRVCGDNIETSQTHAFNNPQFNEPMLRNCVSEIYPLVKHKKHNKVDVLSRDCTKCFVPKSESLQIALKYCGSKNLLKSKKPSDHAHTLEACVKDPASKCIPVALLSYLSMNSLNGNFDPSDVSHALPSAESTYTNIETEGQTSTTSKSMTSEYSSSPGCSDCSDTYLVNLKEDRHRLVKIVRVCINELEHLGKTNKGPVDKNNSFCCETDRSDTLTGRDICNSCLLELSGLCPYEQKKFSENCKLCQKKKSK